MGEIRDLRQEKLNRMDYRRTAVGCQYNPVHWWRLAAHRPVPERRRFTRLHSRLGRSEPGTRAVGSSVMKEFTGGLASHISLYNSFIEDPVSVDHIGRQ